MPRLNPLHLTRDQRRDCQLLRSIGWRYRQIQEKTGFSRRQIQYACTSPATPTKRSGRPPVLTQAQIEDLIGYVCMSFGNRRLSYQQLAEGINSSRGGASRLCMFCRPGRAMAANLACGTYKTQALYLYID